jgi:hypothetical protein
MHNHNQNDAELKTLVEYLVQNDQRQHALTLLHEMITTHDIEIRVKEENTTYPIRNKENNDIHSAFKSFSHSFTIDGLHLETDIDLQWNPDQLIFLYLDFIIHSFHNSNKKINTKSNHEITNSIRQPEKELNQQEKSDLSFIVANLFQNTTENEIFTFQAIDSFCSLVKRNQRAKESKTIQSFEESGSARILQATLANVAERAFPAFVRGVRARNRIFYHIHDCAAVIQERKWQEQMTIKFLFGLYEYSGGIDSPVWMEHTTRET